MNTTPGVPTADDLIDAFATTMPWPLDDFQREALHKLEASRGVLVSAPTSSGKTVVAEYAIWRCLRAPGEMRRGPTEPSRVIYTTPLKALSNQKFHDLQRAYGESNIGLVTGEHTVNDGAPVVVMTTEILRNVLYDEPERLDLVGDVILDEVHYIDDYPRGTVWEEIIVGAPRHIRLIGLSATISNIAEVAEWMSGMRGTVGTVVKTERPVELRLWLGIQNALHTLFDEKGHVSRTTLDLAQNESMYDSRMGHGRRAPDNDLLHVIEELRRRDMLPTIYFIFSRKGCREALARCALHGTNLTSNDEKRRIDAVYAERLTAIEDDDERAVYQAAVGEDMLRRGVAMHHAGMLPYAKETVERLFMDGLIKVVFATETLSLGLNMPARACVVSSFTKFDGTQFAALSSGELTQLMGRAGRRGIDTIGHGIILKEWDVDVRDIYDAALGGEMSVDSKFAPTYTMTLNLLRTRTVEQGEELMEQSFGQYQTLRRSDHWVHREENLRAQLTDLRSRIYRHPRIRCTEKTLTQQLRTAKEIDDVQTALRRQRKEHWHDSRRGRFGGRAADPGGRYEAQRRQLKQLQQRLGQSPCQGCPHLAEHRDHRRSVDGMVQTLHGGEDELKASQHRYKREFRAFRGVLTDRGFLDHDEPTGFGLLAASLYGESSLLVATGIRDGWFDGMEPAELAATLIMMVAEDRGRDRPPARTSWPTDRVQTAFRTMRQALLDLSAAERHHGLNTLRPLSMDYVFAAYLWTEGTPLADIEAPGGTDVGDVVKAVKNLYSMLRQMEQALHGHALRALVSSTRERVERDLIRRV